jgi:hypothetical protein
MSERAERLRDAIREAVIAAGVVRIERGDAKLGWETTTEEFNGWHEVARAICEELGVKEEVLSALLQGLGLLVLSDDNTEAECDAASVGIEALDTLLEASKP